MSERDIAMAKEAGRVAADEIWRRAQDPDEVSQVLETWTGQMQRIVGRAVLKVAWWVLLTALLIGSVKLGLLDKLHAMFGGKP